MKLYAYIVTILFFLGVSNASFSQTERIFGDPNLINVGVYYYPEHWDESQWDRDLKNIADLGFEFTHFAEFAWANLEPQEGVYDFAWLDRALSLAKKHKLKVIMCTSTATPPVWLTRKYPEILLQSEDGTRLDHGIRKHASFSSPTYRKLAMRMIEALAKHYGEHPSIIGWQLDNEPDVQFDYSTESLSEFRKYLKNKYQNISSLNKHWGTSFWSQIYSSFDEITFPQLRKATANPHQILDFRRYAAFQTNSFLDEQSLLIKKYANPLQWITTNYIPRYDEGNIRGCKHLDFETYTCYMVSGGTGGMGKEGYRLGSALQITKANDVFRPIAGTYGVMELQPGQVNWGSANAQPLPGAIRTWLWTIFAGGADLVCTYRYRQPLSGFEQYHYGIVGTDGVTLSKGGEEFQTFIKEKNSLLAHAAKFDVKPKGYTDRKAAILFNHENSYNIDRQKQNNAWNTGAHIDKYYSALKSFGAPVDFIAETDNFQDYKILIAPAYQMVDDGLIAKWTDYVEQGGYLILTCRTGHKDKSGRLFEAPYASKISNLIGASVDYFDLIPDGLKGEVEMKRQTYTWNSWADILSPHSGTSTLAKHSSEFYAGSPVITKHKLGKGTVVYVGVDTHTWELEKKTLEMVYSDLGINILNLPKGLVLEYRNGLGVVVNYADIPYTFKLPSNAKILIGSPELKQADVLVFKP